MQTEHKSLFKSLFIGTVPEEEIAILKNFAKEYTRERVQNAGEVLISELVRLKGLFLFFGLIENVRARLDNLRYPDNNVFIEIVAACIKDLYGPFQTSLFSSAKRPPPLKEESVLGMIEDAEKAMDWLLGKSTTAEPPAIIKSIYEQHPTDKGLDFIRYITTKNTTQDSTVNRRQKDGTLKAVKKKGRAEVRARKPRVIGEKARERLALRERDVWLERSKTAEQMLQDFRAAPETIQRFIAGLYNKTLKEQQRKITVNYAEYAEIAKIDVDKAKKQILESVEYLHHYHICNSERSFWIVSEIVKGKNGEEADKRSVTFYLADGFLLYVLHSKKAYINQKTLMMINDRTNPHARHILEKLSQHYHLNQAKRGRTVSLSVRKLLEALPDMEEWESTERKTEYIIKPFERDLNTLTEIKWKYRGENAPFIERIIEYEIEDYPQLSEKTIEKHARRKAKHANKGKK